MRSKRSHTLPKYVIEKDVPLPERQNKHAALVETTRKLRPKESFLVTHLKQASVSNLMQRLHKASPGRHYIVRTVDGGVRVWRSK